MRAALAALKHNLPRGAGVQARRGDAARPRRGRASASFPIRYAGSKGRQADRGVRRHQRPVGAGVDPVRPRGAGRGLPRLLMAACSTPEGRPSIQPSLHGPAVPAPSGSVTPPRARVWAKVGRGRMQRECPRRFQNSRNPGDRHARPRTRNPRHPVVPTRTLAQ